MPNYIVNGERYTIEDNEMEEFERDFPEAKIEYYNNGSKYGVPLSLREAFLKKAPNATTQQPIAKEGQPKGLLSRLFGNDDEKAERSDFKQPLKAPQEVKQDNTPNIRPITSDSIQPRLTEQPDVAEDEVAEFYNRRQELQKTANRQQVADLSADIESQLERRGKELDAIAAQNPMMMQAHGTAMSIPVFDAGRTTDPEIRDYQAAKRAMENARNIINEADINAKNGKGSSFAAGAARGFGQKFFDLNTYDMGLSDLSDNAAMLKALETADENPDALTPSQQALLDAKAVELATNAYFGSSVGRGYKAGQVTAEAIPFMLEMAINPAKAVGQSLTNKLTRYALKRFGNKEIQKQGAKYVITKAGAKVLGDVAAASGMTATTGAARTAADAVQRMAGGVSPNMQREDGRVEFWKRTQGEESPIKAIAKAFAGTTIENYSEMMGEYFSPVLSKAGGLLAKALDKLGLGKVNRFIDDVSSSDFAQLVKDFEGHAKWNGTIGEFAEEIAGSVLNAAIVGDQTLDTKEGTGVFNKENLIDTFLGVSLLGGAFSGVKTAYYPIYKYEAYNAVNSAKDDLMEAFKDSENVEELERSLSTPQDAANALAKIAISPNFDPNKFEAAARYAQAIQRYNGALLGEQKRRTGIIVEAPEQLEVEQSYDNGRTLESPQEMNDANNQLGYAAAEVRRVFGLDEDTDIDNFLGADPVARAKEERENDEEIGQAILDYLNAKATYDGMIDGVRANIEAQQRHSDHIINQRVNKEDGMIHPALRKVDDKPVYIVNGNIALNDDGTIDNEKSSESVVYLDADTGKLDFAQPSDFHQVSQPINAEEEKTIARNQIAEELAQKASDKIDGVLPFQPNDVYPVLGADGTEHNLQVIADRGDGSVAVKVDGVDGVIPKDEIQQMANAYNLARRDAYNEERKAERIAEQPIAGQTTDATTEPATALSQIPVNENGEQMFEVAPVETTYKALLEMNDGDQAEAIDTAQQMLTIAQQKYDEAVAEKPKSGSSVMEIQQAKAERKEKLNTLKNSVDYWSNVVGYQASLADKERMPQAEEVAEVAPQEVIEEVKPVVEMTPEESAKIIQKVEKRKGMAKAQSALKEKGRYAKEDAELGDYLDFNDYVMRAIATGSVRFKWSNKPDSATRGLGAHLGASASNDERQSRIWMLSNDFGLYPEEAAEQLLTSYAEYLGYEPNIDTMGALSEIIDIVQSYPKSKMMMEAAQARHAKDSRQAENDYYENEYVKQAAEENGMTVDEWMAFIDEYVAQYDDIKAIFAEAYLEYEQLNQNNNEQGTGLQGVQQAVSAAEQNTTNDNRGSEVLPTEQSDTNGGVQQGETERRSDEEAVVQGDSAVSDSEAQGAAVDGTGFEQNNDEQRQANGSRMVGDATQTMGSGIDRGNIRVLEEGLDSTYGKYLSDSERNRRSKESERLVTLAKQNGLFIPIEQTKTLGEKLPKRTGESAVYLNEETGKMFKVKNPYAKSAMKSGIQPEDVIFEHTIHNLLFPETAYTLEGISEDLGDVRIVLSQKLIKAAKQPTQKQITDALAARGLSAEGKYSFGNELVSVTDVEGDNVLLGENGVLYFIDPIINLKKPARTVIDALTKQYQTYTSEQGDIANADNYRFKSVYHGSGADFDKFDHSFIGTGEGHQAFGWGTYVTDVEGIGKQYARMTSKPQLTFKGEFVNAEGFYNPWRIVTDLYKDNQGKLREMRAKAERYSSLVEEDNPKLKALWEDVKQVLATVRSGDLNMKPARHLYSVEIPDDNGSNYIYRDKNVPTKTFDKLVNLLPVEDVTFWTPEHIKNSSLEGKIRYWMQENNSNEPKSWGNFYEALSVVLGSDKAASEFLNSIGYVGIIYPADNSKAKGANNYVIFNEADLDVTDNIRFRSAEAAPTFYSNAEYAVKAVKQEKATPEQWLKMIEKNGGLKAGEDKWLGLSDWLKDSDKKTLTKQEVLDFIKENQIQIEEVVYGSLEETPRFKELRNEYKSLLVENDYNNERTFEAMVDKYGEDFELAFEGWGNDLHINDYYGTEAADAFLDARDINDTRIQYTTDGLDNKREIALTVPTIESWNESDEIHFGDAGNGRAIAWVRFGETTAESKESIAASEAVENYLAEMREKYGTPVGEETDAMSESEILHLQRLTARELNSKEHGERVLVIDEVQSKRHQEGREKGYNNPRVIEILNRLGTIESYMYSPQGLSGKMYSEREELKTELESLFEAENPAMKAAAEQIGQKRVRLAELQQEKSSREDDEKVEIIKIRNKQNEVRNVRDYDYYESEIDEIEKRIENRDSEIDSLKSDINKLNNEYSRYYNTELRNARIGVSPAPFEKNWAELAMKRMLRYAAENGFDKVAWTTGEQQAERYDLSKSIDRIVAEDNTIEEASDGTPMAKDITLTTAGGMDIRLSVDANGVVRGREYDGKKLSDVVGKPLAEKLMEKGDFELEGDGLRIGGEGMKAFYDQMLPSFMNKYGKKWGVKVGEVTMPRLSENNTMHSIDVTDAMRESVMQGQPMFRPAESSNVDAAIDEKSEKVFNNTKAIATAYGIDNSIVVATSEADFKTKMLEAGVEDDYIDQEAIAVYIPETDEIVINSQKATSDENLVESVIHEKAHSLTHNIEKWRAIYDAIIPVGEERFVEFANNVLKENLSPIKSADEIIATFVGKSAILQTEDGRYLVRAMLNNRITSEDIIGYLQSYFPSVYAQYGDVLTAMHPFIQDSLETIKKQYNERRNNVSVSRFGTNTRASNRGNAYRELATPTSDRGSSTIEGVSEVRREPSERRGRTVEERTQSRILAATSLAESLGVKLNVIEDVNDITDSNNTMQRNKRGSKGWYDVDTDQVYFVAPNATSIQDAEESVLHEVVAHKGLRDVVGRERFDAFLGKVYRGASPEIRKAITELAAKKGWDFKVATEEYLASLAERGFEDKENRTFFEKVRDLFMDMLREAKIILGYNINDNDMRYMLWRTYQMQKSKGVMGAAEDVLMQQKLGVGNYRTRPVGEKKVSFQITPAMDAEYMEAVKSGDVEAAQEMVDEAAKAAGYTEKVYHGTDSFGFTEFDLNKSKNAIFTSDNRLVSANYAGQDNYASVRAINKGYKEAASVEDIIHNAESVLGERLHIASSTERNEVINNIEKNAKKVLSKMTTLQERAGEFPEQFRDDVAWIEEIIYDAALGRENGNEGDDMANMLKQDYERYKDSKQWLPQAKAEFGELLSEPQKQYLSFLQGYELGDVAIDAGHSFAKAFSNEILLTRDGQSFLTLQEVEDATKKNKHIGSYALFGNLGNNPLMINSDGRSFYNLDFNGMRTTDEIVKWAKKNGYTSVVFKDIEDFGPKSNVKVFFNPTQVKSADPITYDNNGNIIPLSERFNTRNPDVRFRSTGKAQPAEVGVKNIRTEYDKKVNTGRKGTLKATKYNFIEAMQDEMLSLKEYQELLKKHYGLEKLPSYLDAYMRENRISSAGYEEFLRFEDGVYENMNSIIDEYINKGEAYENIKEYAIAKSGLERNREFTVRDYIDDKANEKLISKTEAEAQLAQVAEDLKNDVITPTEADAKRQQIQNLRSQNKLNAEDVKALKEDYAKKRDAYRKQLSDGHISYSEFNKMSDALAKKFTGRSIEDYSGLSAMAEKKGEKADKWQTVAQDVVAAFESKHKDTGKLWDAIKACNDAVLKKMSDSGLLNGDVYSHLRQQFVWYIPMSGFTEDTAEDVYSYVGNETGAFTPAVKKAAGRLSESDDPFAIIGNKMQGAILQGNRNLLKQTLLNLSRTYPTDLITEDKVWLVKQQDGTWETNMVDIPEGATSEEAAKLIKEHSEKMRKLKKQGLAMEQTNKLSVPYKVTVRSHKNDHEIVAYRNGVPVVMYVNGNPQLAKAINGKLKDRNINIFYELLDKWNRIMSANKTSWNLDFIAPNVLRDFEDAIMSTFIDAGVKDAAKLAKTVVLVFPEVVRSVSGSKNKSGKYANYFEEFLQNGGETGYSHLRDVEKWKEINQRRWKRLNLGEKALKAPKGAFDGIGSMFSYLNRIAEDTTRFGTYVYNREKGKSIGESIKAAKDITTNFNKKGSGATEGIWGFLANFMRRWLLFFNPIVQGLYKHWERMNKNSMRYALVFAAMAGGGYLAAVLNKAASDDDDEEKKYFNQSDYTRRTNIMVYTGDGYVKIPLAPVFREMYALGDIVYSVQSGVITPWEGTKEVVNLVRSLFNLEGQSSLKDQDFSWFRFVIPQSTEFMADLEDNVTFTGTPLYKDTPWNKFDPEYQKVYKGTWTPLVKLSKAVNDILPHEGYMHEVDDQMAGKGSSKWINPAVWQHIIEEVAGGVGKTLGDVITIVDDKKNNKETDIYNIPIAKRFYMKPDERTRGRILKNQYYNATGELERMNKKYKKYTDYLLDNLSDPLEIAAKITEYWNSDAGKMHTLIKDSKSKVDNLDKQLKEAKDDATAKEINLQKENEMNNLIESLKVNEEANALLR